MCESIGPPSSPALELGLVEEELNLDVPCDPLSGAGRREPSAQGHTLPLFSSRVKDPIRRCDVTYLYNTGGQGLRRCGEEEQGPTLTEHSCSRSGHRFEGLGERLSAPPFAPGGEGEEDPAAEGWKPHCLSMQVSGWRRREERKREGRGEERRPASS